MSSDKLIRVRGWLKHSSDTTIKHPMILPKENVISRRIIEHYHEKVKHSGRTTTINEVRSAEFWIVGINQLASSLILCKMQDT